MNQFCPRLNKTSNEYTPLEKALLSSSIGAKGNFMLKSYGKNVQNTLLEQLSTTVATTGHNTGLGWHETLQESLKKQGATNLIKVVEKPTYNYENKFFPRRNITSKIMHIGGSRRGNRKHQYTKFGPKGYIVDKENNDINMARLPDKITGSVPSRVSSKVASTSFIKVNLYFFFHI